MAKSVGGLYKTEVIHRGAGKTDGSSVGHAGLGGLVQQQKAAWVAGLHLSYRNRNDLLRFAIRIRGSRHSIA